MPCPNCSRTFRAGGNGLAFHLTWCKPAQPAPVIPTPAELRADPAIDPDLAAFDARHVTREGTRPEPVLDYSGHDYRPISAGGIRPCPACDTLTDDHGARLAGRPDPLAEFLATREHVSVAPAVARAPRGRKLTRKERRARLRALLARPVAQVHKAPAVRKAAGPKLPAVGAGKHSRCVAHIPMTRTAPGLAFACFDVAPDADAIAERAAFVAVLDAAWNVRHEVYVSRLTPEPTDAARALVGHERAGIHASRLFTPEERAEAFQLEIDLIAERAKPDSKERRATLRRMVDRMSFLRTGLEPTRWDVKPDSITPYPVAA